MMLFCCTEFEVLSLNECQKRLQTKFELGYTGREAKDCSIFLTVEGDDNKNRTIYVPFSSCCAFLKIYSVTFSRT